jgi:hypothetical protein
MRFRIATAALTAALAAPALAADPPCPKCEATCPAPTAGVVVKVFAVADLVTPIPDFAFPTTPGHTRPMPAPPLAAPPVAVAVRPVAVPPPLPVAGHRDILLPTPVGAAQGAFFRNMTLPTPVAVMPPCAGVAACPAAACDEVPPGGVRVVRAESPTTILIGGLKTCEATACAPAAPCPTPKCAPVCGDALVRVVTASVRPASWKCAGGTGTVEFYSLSNSLVVQNAPAVVAEVETLLETLRKAQERTVLVSWTLVCAPTDAAADVFFGGEEPAGNAVRTLTAAEVERLQTALRGHAAQGRVEVMARPQMAVGNGSTGRWSVGQVTKTFTTGIDVRAVNGSSVAVPTQETVTLGTSLTVRPTISGDCKTVKLGVGFEHVQMAGDVPLMPVTTMVTPVFEGGSQGVPVPFTQFIQQPSFGVTKSDCTVALVDGETAVLSLGKRMVETRTEAGVPVLSQVPYVNRLFKNTGVAREMQHVVAVVTARVVTPPCEEKACCEKGCCAAPAAGLVAEYRKAVAAGKTEEAMKLAMKALAADPACFAK